MVILAIIILSSCYNKESKIKNGNESKIISSPIKMNCEENNIAIYNEFRALRLGESSYRLDNFNVNVGASEFGFLIRFKREVVEDALFIEKPRISICENGKLYIGRGMIRTLSSFPPECHFYFKYKNNTGELEFNDDSVLYCGSVNYMKLDEYIKREGNFN